MKKTIGFAMVLALVLSGCNFVGSIVNPVIGTWETTILGVTVSSIYDADQTFTDTNSLGNVGVTNSGTWMSESDILIKTYSDDSTDSFSYSFNSDNTEMTLNKNPDGPSITYARQ
jgi:hypothetical protein